MDGTVELLRSLKSGVTDTRDARVVEVEGLSASTQRPPLCELETEYDFDRQFTLPPDHHPIGFQVIVDFVTIYGINLPAAAETVSFSVV
jgi:hypothetical protein